MKEVERFKNNFQFEIIRLQIVADPDILITESKMQSMRDLGNDKFWMTYNLNLESAEFNIITDEDFINLKGRISGYCHDLKEKNKWSHVVHQGSFYGQVDYTYPSELYTEPDELRLVLRCPSEVDPETKGMKVGDKLPCGCTIFSPSWTLQETMINIHRNLAEALKVDEDSLAVRNDSTFESLGFNKKTLNKFNRLFFYPLDNEMPKMPATVGEFVRVVQRAHWGAGIDSCDEHGWIGG